MVEYIKLSAIELESELLKLIGKYNKIRNTYLLVYAAATEKPIPPVMMMLGQEDFYTIRDFLSVGKSQNVDIYIETRGGSGETAEEIVKFLHSKFQRVSFVVSGEAKSAGTIMVLSGDEILMTETGSLGPIDAQIRIGRSVVSAYDYKEWVEDKQKEAKESGMLNPFDATMVAQITPGELKGALHALDFAKDLVKEWLPKYKFRNWNFSETRKIPVTDEMKINRAKEIAGKLTDRSKWRSHGRSIKIQELQDDIGLKITCIDKEPKLADVVYRIQTILRLLFSNTGAFKIFATQDEKIIKSMTPVERPIMIPPQKLDAAEIKVKCEKCGKNYHICAKLTDNSNIDKECQAKGLTLFPKNARLNCSCGFEIDLMGIKNQIESQTGKKIITGEGQ